MGQVVLHRGADYYHAMRSRVSYSNSVVNTLEHGADGSRLAITARLWSLGMLLM